MRLGVKRPLYKNAPFTWGHQGIVKVLMKSALATVTAKPPTLSLTLVPLAALQVDRPLLRRIWCTLALCCDSDGGRQRTGAEHR